MSKTLLQLRTAVRTALDEATPSFWSNENIRLFLNNAKDRCWLEIRKAREDYFNTTSTFTSAPNVIDYTLPADFSEMRAFRCVTSGYEWLSPHYREQTHPDFRSALAETQATTPGHLYYTLLAARTLRLVPKTDVTLSWSIDYVSSPPDLVAEADVLDLSHPLYKAVQEFAAAEAMQMDRDPNAASYEARGNATIALWLGVNDRQSTDVPHVAGFLEDF